MEIFERRNRVAHASGLINEDYVQRCNTIGFPVEGMKVGNALKLNPRYLHKAVDVLIEFGVTLSFVAWRKLADESDNDAFEYLNTVCYEMIVASRYQLAVWSLDFALHKQSRPRSEVTLRRLFINLANSQKKLKKPEACFKTLDELDWSAASDIFQICIASLKDDPERVAALLPRLAASGEVSKTSFREWPVFDWVRSSPEVMQVFEQTFGEPLSKDQRADKVTDPATPKVTGNLTVH